MAESPSHAFGQIIGDVLELALHQPLHKLAHELGLYLDYKHPRASRGGKALVSWIDGKGNSHDLDYVFEQGGTEKKIGTPKAFIETAWRRYTKHSKNKAQEIEGAVGHLRARYSEYQPALAVVLGGEFTDPSLQQLRSHGFIVLHFSYGDIIAAFAKCGVDLAYEEATSDTEMQAKLDAFKVLSDEKRKALPVELRKIGAASIEAFLVELRTALTRTIKTIRILPLYSGEAIDVSSIEAAVIAIDNIDETSGGGQFARYEVDVRYSNGSEIRGTFKSKGEAKEFLMRAI
jgi:hypothetical protein